MELDVLEALDGLQWLRSGEEASQLFGRSQSTISRACRKALRVFALEMQLQQGEWELLGDPTFVRLERQVHQLARRRGLRPLRLEATYWSAPTLCRNLPPRWILGRSNIVGVRRNFQLLQERVTDAWVAGLPDLPTDGEPELMAIVLTRMPVFFTCAPGHPLLQCEHVSWDDIAAYPSLALPAGSYPQVEQGLKDLGLWNDGVRMTRYRRDQWEGKSEAELVIGYGTPLSMQVSGGRLCRLPLLLPFASGDALVLRRDMQADPGIAALLAQLRDAARELAAQDPEIEIAEP